MSPSLDSLFLSLLQIHPDLAAQQAALAQISPADGEALVAKAVDQAVDQARQEIPEEKSVEAARSLIHQAYESEFSKVANNAEPLIIKLVESSRGTKDPAKRYAMLLEAEQLAVGMNFARRD